MERKKPRIWRTPATQKQFHAYIDAGHLDNGCDLCRKETITSFQYWRIVENSFPYDAVASLHHMLMPLRHTTEEELTEAELAELYQLKQTVLNTDYNFLMECLPKAKSIPEHHHLHLIVPKTV